MLGTSRIAICDVAGVVREITARNVVFWGLRLAPPDSAEVVTVMAAGRHWHITLFS